MHYTGTIWRPPYESGSLLLEATAGCTHHRCKFCTLYDELPFHFRLSPLEDIEADLAEAQELLRGQLVQRVFLVGANPFALQTERLKAIAGRIRKYFPECRTIGCFARVTDVGRKTDEALRELRRLGYDGLTIGVETGYSIRRCSSWTKAIRRGTSWNRRTGWTRRASPITFSIWPELPGPDAERRRPWPARRCSIRPAPASWAAPC